MSQKKKTPAGDRRRATRGRVFRVEALEERALLTVATETFSGPSLTALITEARRGKDTAPQTINTMVKALQTQLDSGPLADLNSGAVDGNGFIQEVQSLESSYEQNTDQQLSPEFPNVDELIKLQGQAVLANLVALNQQESVGLISSSALATDARAQIGALTAGPIKALNTPLSAYASTTQTFVTGLNTLAQSLSTTATPALTPAQVSTTVTAEAEAYRATMHAGLQVTHPNVSSMVDSAVNTLENTALAIASDTSNTDAQTQLTSAISTFDTTLLDTTGLFGRSGPISKAGSHFTANLTNSPVATTLSTVSGSLSSSGGTATLTATLTSSTGQGLSGKTVSFTLDGAFAGIATTDSSGLATLSGVPTSDTSTSGGDIVATFGGDINDLSSSGSGNLTINQATALSNVSGTAEFGGPATLMATLTSGTSNTPLAGQSVDFTLDGVSVGTETTDSNGVATLSGVATSDAVGTDTGGIVASFAGNTGFNSSATSGDLVVSQATTALNSVAGTATVGGTATLTATLTSGATGAGISGQPVTFTLDGVSVGTETTDSNGLATLTDVATSDAVGTGSSNVTASFVGSTNYAASNGTGNLVVSATPTSLTAVSGTAPFGGPATLTATLTSGTSNTPLSGQTVTFTLDGTSVGTETTDSNGVATLSGVATTDPVGTGSSNVTASFAATTTFAASTGTGNLVVSAATTSVSAVSATAPFGGSATLTATLTSGSPSIPVANQSVNFTLNGTSVGSATTNSSGVATLTNIPTSAAVGTDTGAVVATFLGTTDYTTSSGTGNLVVSQAATALNSVSGTAPSGGPATLTATLISSVTGLGISGQTVSFTLDGTSAGTATTDSNGVATVTNVPTSDGTGTDTGGVVVNYAGDTDYVASNGKGDLVVS